MDSERVLPATSVLVRDGIVVAMGENASVHGSDDAVVINAEGKYLLPGFSDMHGHVYATGEYAKGSVAETQMLLYAAGGVTLIRDVNGSDEHFNLRSKIDSRDWTGPELVFTSTIIEGEQAVWGDFAKIITDADDVEPHFAALSEKGYWGVKLYHTVSSEVYDAALTSAERHGLFVVGHVPFEVGIERALDASQFSIEHFRGYDFDGMSADELFATGGRDGKRFGSWTRMTDERMNELVNQSVLSGGWNCPTLAVNRFLFDAEGRSALADEPRIARTHPALATSATSDSTLDAIFSADAKEAMALALPRQLEFVSRLHDAGAKLLIGTDSGFASYIPGFGVADEMKYFVKAGISPYQTLKIATVNAAESVQAGHRIGKVGVGMQADLVLLNANPLDDIAAIDEIAGVMLKGEWYTLQQLEQQLDELVLARQEQASEKQSEAQ